MLKDNLLEKDQNLHFLLTKKKMQTYLSKAYSFLFIVLFVIRIALRVTTSVMIELRDIYKRKTKLY